MPICSRPRSRRTSGSRAARRRFSRAELLDKIRAWTELYGAPPQTKDWEPARARAARHDWRVLRYRAGDWPSAGMLRRQFGTFNAAIRAAGLEPSAGPTRYKRHVTGPEQVLAAIVEWNRRFGAPPSQTDWDAARARRTGQAWRIARYQEGDWPSLNTVRRHFGSLNRAIELAGLRARRPGQRRPVGSRRLQQVADPAPASRHAAALAEAVRAVAMARYAVDPKRLRDALAALAGEARAWADEIDAE
jgi:hypothetical protein